MNEQLRNNESRNNGSYNGWDELAEIEQSGEKIVNVGEELNRCLDLRKLINYFDDNAEILHKSKYHREGFKTHCLLVIDGMIDQREAGNVSEEAVVAACLHDIAKPRTAALNKRNEACFYGHENVTDEELAEFLDKDYAGFDYVADLVRGHMLPLGVGENTPEPFRSNNLEKLNGILDRHDDQFKNDLMTLSKCDSGASVKSDDDVLGADERADNTRSELLNMTK